MHPSHQDIDTLLARPRDQRLREYKHRCAQAIIFGLPVVGLHWFGESLGGPPDEARRWSAILQAILAGWVTYVAAAGMVAEGILAMGRRFNADFIVAVVAVILYVASLVSVLGVFVVGQPFYRPLLFHVDVILLAGWCGWRWWQLNRAP